MRLTALEMYRVGAMVLVLSVVRVIAQSTCVYYNETTMEKCLSQNTCHNRTSTKVARDLPYRLQKRLKDMYDFMDNNCRCDKDCVVYGDCCVDVDVRNDVGTRPSFKCRRNEFIHSYGLEINVVETCSDRTNTELTRLCEVYSSRYEDIFSVWPVTSPEGHLYKSPYCAECNKVSKYTYWLANASCTADVISRDLASSPNITKVILSSRNCSLTFSDPHSADVPTVRFCKPVIKKCQRNYKDECVRHLCEDESAVNSYVYKDRFDMFRNIYCAQCNDDFQDIQCTDKFTRTKVIFDRPELPYPLSLIIDMRSKSSDGNIIGHQLGQVERVHEELKQCEYNQVYDPLAGKCRLLACPVGAHQDECLKQELTSFTGNTSTCVYIIVENFTLFDNGTLMDRESSTLYYKFFIIADKILVCTNYSQNYTVSTAEYVKLPIFKFTPAQALLSFIGQMISIIALTVHLIVYTLLPTLRNFAGKTLMCLSASLLAAQLSFLIGVRPSAARDYPAFACVTLGAFTHYCFLCAFFWMNLTSYDICLTFSRKTNHNTNSGNRRFVVFSLYGWGMPGLIVLSAIIADTCLPANNAYRPGYGESVCWFTSRKGLRVFFGVPLLFVIVSNLVFYIVTVINIVRVRKSTKMVNTSSGDKCKFLLYFKLCAIMGLTWLFAFIATSSNLPVFWYLFIILNSLQGFFICFAFVLTPKAMRLLKAKSQNVASSIRERLGNHDTGQSDSNTKSTSLLTLNRNISQSNNMAAATAINLSPTTQADVKLIV